MSLDDATRGKIAQHIASDTVVLFMKGTRTQPQCGFSASVVRTLEAITPSYTTVDVLADPAIRDGIKAFSNWPTIPQLYIRGEFVGGADIVRDLNASGELHTLIGATPPAPRKVSVQITAGARKAFAEALAGTPGDFVRLEITPAFEHDLSIGPREASDTAVEVDGLTVLFDPDSVTRADGLRIDFVEGPNGAGFKLENPNEPAQVQPLSVKTLKQWMDQGRPFELFDVRTEKERATAKIDRARWLDAKGQDDLLALDRNAVVVFQCHHGGRSRMAAQAAVAKGFRNVFNLEGGIDAWSLEVDPTIPRY